MDYVGKQIKRCKTISELLEIWVDGSKGLELLRFRHNKLSSKGELSVDRQMLYALEKGVTKEVCVDEDGFAMLSLDGITQVNETYNIDFRVDDADKTTLAGVLLLHYLSCGDYRGLDYQEPIEDKIVRTLRDSIFYLDTTPELNLRERIWSFKFDDSEFLEMYGAGLKDLLSEEHSVLALEMKKILNDFLAVAWTEHEYADSLKITTEIEQVLRADKTEVTAELVEGLNLTKDFAVSREYSKDRIYYRVNTEALEVFAKMVKDLGLDGLDENKFILKMIAKDKV